MNAAKKIKIAVTGGIGSGKSAFCGFHKQTGIPVINADDVAKDLLENDKEIVNKITGVFGEESYINGKPDKKFIAEKVFSNHQNVLKINSIIHPKLIKKVNILAAGLLNNNNIIAAEAALIFEAGMEDLFDYIILITAEKEIRMNRKVKFDNYTEEQFLKRNVNQIPDNEKAKLSDFVFENNGSLEDLKSKTGLLLKIIKGLQIANS